MVEVKVKHKNIEKALSIFKRKVKDSKMLLELQQREYYEKPSAKRRKARLNAKLRQKIATKE